MLKQKLHKVAKLYHETIANSDELTASYEGCSTRVSEADMDDFHSYVERTVSTSYRGAQAIVNDLIKNETGIDPSSF